MKLHIGTECEAMSFEELLPVSSFPSSYRLYRLIDSGRPPLFFSNIPEKPDNGAN